MDWWTLALQTINVVVLIWILARFLFRPVAEIVAKRQDEANRLLAEADAARQQAADVSAEADAMRAGIAAERNQLVAEAQKEAQAEKDSLTAKASKEVAELRSKSDAAIARNKAAAEQDIVAHASELSVEIARRLCEHLPPELLLEGFLDELSRQVRTLPRDELRKLTSASVDSPIGIVTATPLSAIEVEQVRRTLSEALGSNAASFEFRSDPALIAGIELHGHNMVLRNSWQGHLDRIRQELSRVGSDLST